jgi:hypothetical protein
MRTLERLFSYTLLAPDRLRNKAGRRMPSQTTIPMACLVLLLPGVVLAKKPAESNEGYVVLTTTI